jgi:hypothetical protein
MAEDHHDHGDVFEVDFRLDANGRTALNDDHDASATLSPDYSTKVCRAQLNCAVPRPPPSAAGLSNEEENDLPSKINAEDDDPTTAAANDDEQQIFKELLFDCEIADSGLMPRTFWLAATDAPRCTLEQFARDIFVHHTAPLVSQQGQQSFDLTRSGAEWWVQIRPSPDKTGKYAMHGDPTDPNEEQGVCFHWDKDEELRTICGGSTYVHPHWSTVTYLTGNGAPTLILEECRVDNLTGAWKDDGAATKKQAVVSWPDQWKHLSFDGRWLHAVPGDLAIASATPDQRRYTFLVNIWLNHIPCDTKLFPASMLDKLSGHEGCAKASCRTRLCLRLGDDKEEETTIRSIILNPGDNCSFSSSTTPRTWPMGDPGETVTVLLPNDITTKHPSMCESAAPTKTSTTITTHAYRWPEGLDGIVLQKPDDRASKRPRTAGESSDIVTLT